MYQQMRSALLAFESEVSLNLRSDRLPSNGTPECSPICGGSLQVGYAAPARERAFFSALRTQLMEAAACREPEQRDMQLAAAYKWFSKHKCVRGGWA